MYHKSKYLLANARIIFRIFLLILHVLPAFFSAQTTMVQGNDIYISEGAFISDQNSIIKESPKTPIYISTGTMVYYEDHITNAEIIELSKTLDKNVSSKHQKDLAKKISRKIKIEKKYTAKTSTKLSIKLSSESKNSISFNSSAGNSIVTPANSLPKFISSNIEYKTELNNFKYRNLEIFSQNFAFSGSFHFYIYVRPPPTNI